VDDVDFEEPPPPDAHKLLTSWMEWEKGEESPGRVMANLKTGGMRQLLESLAASTPQQ
jgi:hypothetical protein